MTNILTKEEVYDEIEQGVKTVVDSVKFTLGPVGKNAIIFKEGRNFITNDGVTIARQIHLDGGKGYVADILKQACEKTNYEAGDGTTTATLLAGGIITNGLRAVKTGANPLNMRKGIFRARDFIVGKLTARAKQVCTKDEIKNVATISCKNISTGELIAEAVTKVGKDAVITIENGDMQSDKFILKRGFKFDKGIVLNEFLTDRVRALCEFESPYILIVKGRIKSSNEILPIMEKVRLEGGKLILICEEIEKEPTIALAINNLKGILKCAVINAPFYQNRKSDFLDDLCVYTNARLFDMEKEDLKSIEISDLGRCEKIISTFSDTTIIGSQELDLKDYIDRLRQSLEVAQNQYDREYIKERIARLVGKAGEIRVAGKTEIEMTEQKMRVEDALNAVRVAMSDGVVAGGGIALLNCYQDLRLYINNLVGDEKIGAESLLKALEIPAKLILENSGVESDLIVSNLKVQGLNIGYNLETEKYCNMLDAGIIDPLKVTLSALNNACSVASSLLTTDVIIVEQ